MDKITIAKVLDESIIKNNFSGVISIKEKDKIIYQSATGYLDRSNSIENHIDTRFGIASGTKLFTALAIGVLIDQGKISLYTKISDIIDYDFNYSKEVTIRHLLTHTSGIPDYYDEEENSDFDNFKVAIPWYELKQPKDYFPIFPLKDMIFIPGTEFMYCNSGYVLLAAIVAQISGMQYTDFVEKNIFNKIGMTNSGFFALNKLPYNTAQGYIEEENGWHTNVYNLPIVGGGDGGAFTNVDDLYILWNALFDYEILSKDLTEIFIQPYIKAESEAENTYYGHGIWIYDDAQSYLQEYIEGCDAGVSFRSAIIREKDIVYSVISNTGYGAWPIIRDIENDLINDIKS